MAVEQIKETDTLNQGRVKINDILIQSNASSEKVDNYKTELTEGINDAKKIAKDAGNDAVAIATEAGNQANETANQALDNSKTAITTADKAVSTANNNKQEFDTLRNDFDQLVAESGDSNPEIVQARTDTQGIKRTTLANRLQIDFEDRMTKADGMTLFSGSTNVKSMMDFNGKTAGNTTTNPHKYFTDFTAKMLKKPSDTWNEVSQSDYNRLANRDDTGVTTGSTQSGVIPQQMGLFDVVEAAKKMTPQLYEDMNRIEVATSIKTNFVSFTISSRVKATSPNNKNIKISSYLQSTDSWATQIQETATELTDFTVQINDKNYITDEGYIYLVSYTDPSNGVTSASLDTDYVGIQLELSTNAQDILEKSGFVKNEQLDNHINDKKNPHLVTKEQVGLGSVANYSFANDGESVAGTSTTKYMNPKNVADAIKGQSVTQTGDQEIDGVKNYRDSLQVGGKEVELKLETDRLWTGAWVMNASQTVNLTKKVTDCRTGIILLFQPLSDGKLEESTVTYFHVPKSHVIYHSGVGINIPITSWAGKDKGIKYLYITDTQIKGNAMNGNAPNNILVLSEVLEY